MQPSDDQMCQTVDKRHPSFIAPAFTNNHFFTLWLYDDSNIILKLNGTIVGVNGIAAIIIINKTTLSFFARRSDSKM